MSERRSSSSSSSSKAERKLERLRTGDSISPDSSALVGRRLGIAAAIASVVHAIYVILYRTVWAGQGNSVGLITGLIGGVASTFVAFYLLRGERPVERVAIVGVVYEIILGLTLGLSESTALDYHMTTPQISWSAVVIVLFPFLVPAAPRLMLAASLATAAMTPIAMALVFATTGRAWPPMSIAMSFIVPLFICAVLAWAPTRVLSQLRVAVQRARRLGNYELTERLGAGGMGEVWRAKHRLLARPAAVKIIKPEMLGAKNTQGRDTVIRRFEREAQVTASLDSLHTVELYDFGVSADGALFYVMELLDGVDLDTLVERFGPLPSERVVHLLMQACDSLEDAHRRGLIHRDIKPANLFVSRKGGTVDFVKLLDFGLVKRWNRDDDDDLVKHLEATAASLHQTAANHVLGTPAFLAPEAAVGEQAVDHRADIYALGCVAYWMLTAQLVFEETTVLGMAVAHVTKDPAPPSKRVDKKIIPELEALVLECLSKDRNHRPASAESLRDRLSRIPLESEWTRARALAWWKQNLPTSDRQNPSV